MYGNYISYLRDYVESSKCMMVVVSYPLENGESRRCMVIVHLTCGMMVSLERRS